MARRVVLVVGMHRSGTSMVTELLSELGGVLPPDLLEAAPDNPRGFFESEPVVAAHDRLLLDLGSSWDDPSPLRDGWLEGPEALEAAAALRHELDRLPPTGVAILKDPRLCRLLPLWQELLAGPELELAVLLVLRRTGSVASSLLRRDGFPADAAVLLTARYLLEALDGIAGLRTVPSAVVDDADVLTRGAVALRGPLEALGLAEVLDREPGDVVEPALQRASPAPPMAPLAAELAALLDVVLEELTADGPALGPSCAEGATVAAIRARLDEVELLVERITSIRQRCADLVELRTGELEVVTADRDNWIVRHDEQEAQRLELSEHLGRVIAELEELRSSRSVRWATRLRELTRRNPPTAP